MPERTTIRSSRMVNELDANGSVHMTIVHCLRVSMLTARNVAHTFNICSYSSVPP